MYFLSRIRLYGLHHAMKYNARVEASCYKDLSPTGYLDISIDIYNIWSLPFNFRDIKVECLECRD